MRETNERRVGHVRVDARCETFARGTLDRVEHPARLSFETHRDVEVLFRGKRLEIRVPSVGDRVTLRGDDDVALCRALRGDEPPPRSALSGDLDLLRDGRVPIVLGESPSAFPNRRDPHTEHVGFAGTIGFVAFQRPSIASAC